jgi:hypothetical protein
MSQKYIENLSRRDFFKLKFLLMMYTYFYQFFGTNLLAKTKLSDIDYSILEKLLKIPFTQEIKDEINLRVKLQKRYCYDANGNLNSLNRFLKETTNFIISKKSFKDFKLLNLIKDKQLDYGYMLNCTARHNEVNSMKLIQTKLLSTNNNMLDEAMLYAIKSQSFNTTINLMQQKMKINKNTQKVIMSLFQQEEYDIFYKKLSGTDTMKLLPYNKKFNIKNIRRVSKKSVMSFEDAWIYFNDFEQNLFAIVYNSIADMYMQYFIDDYTVELYNYKVYIKVWSHNNIYPIDFFEIYERILRANGFNGLQESFASCEINDTGIKDEIVFQLEQNNVLKNGIDHYEFINIEIL